MNASAPAFDAYGSACLTGAPANPTPPPSGPHPLTGCPPVPPVPVPQPPTDAAPLGYLQLTDARMDQVGAVLHDTPIPSTQGVEITFEQWQYGSTSVPPVGNAGGADGISFFLIDGAATLDAPGAFGGSLGYAQKLPDNDPANPFLPGVNHGYIGIGLDVFGNYFGDWERRGYGCAQRSPAGTVIRIPAPGENQITVRGPGHQTTGYCFLTATTSNFTTTGPWPSTLPGRLRGPLAILPANPTPETANSLLEPSRRTVSIRITPAPNPQVTVFVDFGTGARDPVQVLSFAAPQPVPASYKFGFGSSTGLFTDVHLIRKLRITTLGLLPALNLVKQVRKDPPLPAVLNVGDTVPYQYTVTNTTASTVTDLTVVDSVVSPIVCDTTTLAPGQSTACYGSHVVTEADVIDGSITNVARATAIGPDGPITSPEATLTIPIGGETGLGLAKEVDATRPYREGETVHYTYRVTNLTSETVSDVTIVDDRLADAVCEQTVLQPAGATGDSTTCRTTYTVTAADTQAGSVTNRAVALGDGGQLRSAAAQATIQIEAVAPPPTCPPPPTPATPISAPTLILPSLLAATGAPHGAAAMFGLTALLLGVLLRIAGRRQRERPGGREM